MFSIKILLHEPYWNATFTNIIWIGIFAFVLEYFSKLQQGHNQRAISFCFYCVLVVVVVEVINK